MILPLLLAQTPPAPAPATPDVVVTAARLRKLRLATAVRDGKLANCEVRASSGDVGIDRIACPALQACVEGGVIASEPLADCIDKRVAAFVRDRADAAIDKK